MEAFLCVPEVRGLSYVQRSDGRKAFSVCQSSPGGTRVGNTWDPERLPENCSLKRVPCFVTPEGFSTSSCEVRQAFLSVLCWKTQQYNTLNLWSFFPSPSIFLASCSSVVITCSVVPCYIPVLLTCLWPCKGVIPGICNRLIYTLRFMLFTKRQRSPAGDRTYLNHVSLTAAGAVTSQLFDMS